MTTPKDVEPGKKYQCDNCGKIHTGAKLKDIQDLSQRVDVGGEVPAGECPACGALCYIVKEEPTCSECSSTKDVQSTYCGSFCKKCVRKHVKKCAVCRKDVGCGINV